MREMDRTNGERKKMILVKVILVGMILVPISAVIAIKFVEKCSQNWYHL